MSMPMATCRRTTCATPSAMTAASARASATGPRSRANSTSVTAWLRGRLPTCVVRIRSVLWRMARWRGSAVDVVRLVIPCKPALQGLVGIGTALAADLLGVGCIEREFQDQAVGIMHVDRSAVPVLEHKRVRRLDACLGDPGLDSGLRFGIHCERDVVKRRRRHLRPEFLLVLGVGELEEGEGATVAHAKEGVTV